MAVKNVILSKKGADLLEKLIIQYGLVVTFDQVFDALKKDHTRQQAHNRVTDLVAAGWLVRIKKSLYYITSLESRGYTGMSQLAVAQCLDRSAYVSFEAALQYHGMFDQLLGVVRSVTRGKNRKIVFQDTAYTFVHAEEKHFFGVTEEYKENQKIAVATAEKALCDILHFRRGIHDIDIVLEKFRDHRETLDFSQLMTFAKQDTLTVSRIFGFLLDQCGENTAELYEYVRGKRGYSRMTADRVGAHYDARWKLYYHDHFKQA